MEILITTEKRENKAVLNSLFSTLSDNQYINENAQPQAPNSKAPRMSGGAEFVAIELFLGIGFKIVELAHEIAKWMRELKAPDEAIVFIPTGGRQTVLYAGDVEDSDRNFAVRRAIVGAPDPRKSQCVLIGISDYGKLSSLPKVRKNLAKLREVLQDPDVWGIPDDRLTVVYYPRTARDIIEKISASAANASDALLIYFAGHGLYDEDNGLLLALPGASGKNSEQTVRWTTIAEILQGLTSCQPIVWLDCCYAGLALTDMDFEPANRGTSDLLEAAEVRGTYLFVATTKYEEARTPDADECTAFTGALVGVLSEGIKPGPPTEEFLTLNSLSQEVSTSLKAKELPRPQWDDPAGIGMQPQFRNNFTGSKPKNGDLKSSPRGPSLWDKLKETFGKRRSWPIAIAVIAALALIGGVATYLLTPGRVISGVDFSKYCSTLAPVGAQRFGVSGDSCVQPVNLDSACAFTYPDQASGLKAVFLSADPYSAACEGPASGAVNYGGISDMTGYCVHHTRVSDVKATAKDPSSMNSWICQVAINKNLACDQQNNRTDLVARQEEDQTWLCRETH